MRVTLCVLPLISWTLAAVAVIVMVFSIAGIIPGPSAKLGIVLLVIAATLHIQHCLERAVDRIVSRELAAYELGRLRGI